LWHAQELEGWLRLRLWGWGGRHGGFFIDWLRLFSTHDRRSKVVSSLTSVVSKEYFWGQWER
jgi:hypothetical protein